MLNEIRTNRLPPISLVPKERRVRPSTARRRTHILVPTSLEPPDVPALWLAVQLAATQPHTLTLLHVESPLEQSESQSGLDAIRLLHQAADQMHGRCTPSEGGFNAESASQKAREFVETTVPGQLLRGVNLRVECSSGDAADAIVKYAEEHAVDIVIMAGGVKRRWWPMMSARVRRVLRLSRQQVILVHASLEKPTDLA